MTGARTGPFARDKFTVEDDQTRERVQWGKVNQPFPPEKFQALLERVLRHMAERDLYILDLAAGAITLTSFPIQVVCEYAWHALFVKASSSSVPPRSQPASPPIPRSFVVIGRAGNSRPSPTSDGVSSSTFILTGLHPENHSHRRHKICREMKKSILRRDEHTCCPVAWVAARRSLPHARPSDLRSLGNDSAESRHSRRESKCVAPRTSSRDSVRSS